MPLDFRYHLASLTAVFLALLLGLLLGVGLNEGSGLSRQVEGLRTEFRRSQVLRGIDQRAEEFNRRTQTPLIRYRLVGRNIALVYNRSTFPQEQVEAVRQVLEEAGGQVTVVVTLRTALAQLSREDTDDLCRKLGVYSVRKDSHQVLIGVLTREIGQDYTPATTLLEREKLLLVKGDISRPVSTVVLLGGGGIEPSEVVKTTDLPLLRACVERKLRVAAVETLETPNSAIAEYKRIARVTTVDNIDRYAGRIALVLALSSGQIGHYGYKETAREVVPANED
jgi:hypothetical protein